MLCKVAQEGQVIVKSSDKMWSTGGGNDKPFQYIFFFEVNSVIQ